ncbi:type II secretion system protein GspK [Ferrovibrio sp.]|uniref:type II secretion system protein GspK n=1 Tax=Ferrovibrio sp. TaxID=1917215 RepID=UPI001B736CF8|nr:type II secretion system protein GspK [Ferrovibrio sp.]MBP7064738.1 general secretion pathway protein GspK [Ferrovibrio sp.]
MKPAKDKTGKQQGFALVVVVAGLALLAGALALLAQRGVAESYGTANLLLRARQIQAADAGLAIALQAVLRETSVPAEAEFDGMRLGLRVGDVAQLVDVNAPTAAEKLLPLLRQNGVDAAAAQDLLAVLADWIDADDRARPQGAEAVAYRAAGLGYGPRNAPLESLAELPLLFGFPTELYPRLLPHLTVHNAAAGAVLVVDVAVGAPGEAGIFLRRSLVALQPAGRRNWQLLAQYDLPE